MHAGSFQVSDIVQYKNIWSNMLVFKYIWGNNVGLTSVILRYYYSFYFNLTFICIYWFSSLSHFVFIKFFFQYVYIDFFVVVVVLVIFIHTEI